MAGESSGEFGAFLWWFYPQQPLGAHSITLFLRQTVSISPPFKTQHHFVLEFLFRDFNKNKVNTSSRSLQEDGLAHTQCP